MTSPLPRPETVEKLGRAVYPSFAMLAGMQLDVFTPLKDGPMSAEQIAEKIGVSPGKLRRVLYALVTAELLTVQGDLFSNTPEADHSLVRGTPAYIGGRHEAFSRQWSATLKTADTILAGSPQAKHDFSTMSPDEQESFFRGLHPANLAAGRNLVRTHNFSTYRNLLDVGGGSGGLTIAITEACPQLRATVVDLPNVTPITQRFVEEAGATNRVHVMTADVVSGPLVGTFDVAVLRTLIQVLSPEQALQAISNVSQVVEPSGDIYILGAILDDSRLSPPEIVAQDLLYLNNFDEGRAYTEQEYKDWLTEAGFDNFKRVVLPNASSVVTARKPR